MGIPLFRPSLVGGRGMLFSNASFCGPPRGPRPRRASPPAGPISSDPAPDCVAAAVFCPLIPFPVRQGRVDRERPRWRCIWVGWRAITSQLVDGRRVCVLLPDQEVPPALPQLREMASLVTEERCASVAGNFQPNSSQTRPCLSPLTGHRDCVQQEENAFLNCPTLDPPKAKGTTVRQRRRTPPCTPLQANGMRWPMAADRAGPAQCPARSHQSRKVTSEAEPSC